MSSCLRSLHAIWQRHHDDLSHPRYTTKPRLKWNQFNGPKY